MRATLAYIISICFLTAKSQHQSIDTNTTLLNEVVLADERYSFAKPGQIITEFNDSLLVGSFINSYADVMAHEHSVHVRSYGPGLSSTFSSHGNSSSQVGLFWHNIPLNSPALGSTDLSLIPSNSFSARLLNGGNSSIYGSQSIGASLILDESDSYGKNSLELGLIGGSFSNYGINASLNQGNENWNSKTSFNRRIGQNNYEYYYNNVSKERKNANVDFMNLTQSLSYTNNNNFTISGDFWYTNSKRNSPNSVLVSVPGKANLFDEIYRLSLESKVSTTKGVISMNQGFLKENQVFNDPSLFLNEGNYSFSSVSKVSYLHHVNRNLMILTGIDFIHSSISGDSKLEAKRDNASLFASASYEKNRTEIVVTIRQETIDSKFTPIIPSLSINQGVYDKLSWIGHVGYNFRYPTLNDMYWSPGGNPSLLNEKGWSGETGLKYLSDNLKISGTYFLGQLDNYIQWVPQISGLWSPENVKKIQNSGVDVNVGYFDKYQNLKFSIDLGYTFTQATVIESEIKNDNTIGNQLIYTPKNKFSNSFLLGYRNVNFVGNVAYTDEVFSGADMSVTSRIDPYWLASFEVNYSFMISKSLVRTYASVKNAFDQQYQTIKNYPLPGVNFEIGLIIKIKTKK